MFWKIPDPFDGITHFPLPLSFTRSQQNSSLVKQLPPLLLPASSSLPKYAIFPRISQTLEQKRLQFSQDLRSENFPQNFSSCGAGRELQFQEKRICLGFSLLSRSVEEFDALDMSTSSWSFDSKANVRWGWIFILVGSVSFLGFFYAAILSKLLPQSENWIISAIQNDRYYCLLVPLTLPVLVVAVYFHWLSMKLFKHA